VSLQRLSHVGAEPTARFTGKPLSKFQLPTVEVYVLTNERHWSSNSVSGLLHRYRESRSWQGPTSGA
jgi:hypothetical protein